MSDEVRSPDGSSEESLQAQAALAEEPSLAEVSARRVAARTQWQKALARAKERFSPGNVREEMVETAADTVGTAVDKAGSVAWAHRGKLALAGIFGGLFLARKPIARVAVPAAEQARNRLGTLLKAIGERTKR